MLIRYEREIASSVCFSCAILTMNAFVLFLWFAPEFQGYVDEDADIMGKIGSFFGGGEKKKKATTTKKEAEKEPKKNKWPWEQ